MRGIARSARLGGAFRAALKAALLVALLVAPLFPAPAHDYRLGDIEIVHPWARATAVLARTGAVYLTLANQGAELDHLLGVATPRARKARLHSHIVADGIVKMRPVKAIEISPGDPAVLQPGGFHIMLMGLEAPLEAGTAFPLTLSFERAGAIEVEIRVENAGATGPSHHGDGDHAGRDHADDKGS